MIILLPTAFPFTQTTPFTNLQLDPPQPPLQIYHHSRSATTTRLILTQVLYTPAKQSTTSLHTTAITMSTSERNPVDIITSHQATIFALTEPTIANIREPLTEAELTTYQRFVRKLNESAQATQEACMSYGALVASKTLKKPPAPHTDSKMAALFKKNWAAFRAAGGVTQAWASPDSIVDMHRRGAKRVDRLKEEWKEEYERAGLVDKMVSS